MAYSEVRKKMDDLQEVKQATDKECNSNINDGMGQAVLQNLL